MDAQLDIQILNWLSKVVLAFEKPFWADENGVIGGATLTDLPVKQIYYEMNTHKSGTF